MLRENMKRVGKANPCPVCTKPDWCLIAEDGSAAICARVEEGSVKKCGDAGWLHMLRDVGYPRRRAKDFGQRICMDIGEAEYKDFGQLTDECQQRLTADDLSRLSRSLGVSQPSLRRLQVGWDGQAFTFPMKDSNGNIIGIRRRFPLGSKISVKGGKTGLFIPVGLDSNRALIICEGPTDTAAALTLGFDAIGRPNCNSKIEMTAKAARGRREIAIIGDNDEAGRAGAEKLADALALHYPCVKVICSPDGVKDLREWLRAGLNTESLQQIIERTKPVDVNVSF